MVCVIWTETYFISLLTLVESKLTSGEKQLALLRRCIRSILTRLPGPDDMIPATYEGIYNTCRSVIMVSHLGDKLHDILRIELVQSIARLSKTLTESTETETKWIATFNKALKWFDDQIVSFWITISSECQITNRSQSLLRSLMTYLDQVYLKDVLHIRLAFCEWKTPFCWDHFIVNSHTFSLMMEFSVIRRSQRDWERQSRIGWTANGVRGGHPNIHSISYFSSKLAETAAMRKTIVLQSRNSFTTCLHINNMQRLKTST